MLHDDDPRPQLVAMFGEFDEARVEATLAGLRHALVAAFPADAVATRYVLEGAAPVTCLAVPPHVTAERAILLGATPSPDTPSLEARLDLGCLASVSVRRAVSPPESRPFDDSERRLFAAIVDLVRRRDSPL